ncbi:SH3 domain protein [Trypanosoma cruzi]|nr:SH3 domain protein [Trypanosoma cruzi]
MNAGDGSPIQSATSHQSSQAAHCIADAPSDVSNRPTQSSGRVMELIRKRRSTVVRRNTEIPPWASYMRKANEATREMWAPSTWERGMSLAGQFTTFCRTHEQPMNEESCAAFLMAIDVAPSTRLQYARMLRSMLEMDRTPLDMVILGYKRLRRDRRRSRHAP